MINNEVSIIIDPDYKDHENAERIRQKFINTSEAATEPFVLKLDEEGLALIFNEQVLRGDFTHMLPRLKSNNLSKELLVRTAKIKKSTTLTAIDATAGLGEDSLLLAAAGFHVKLYEHNPIIYELVNDSLKRASKIPELADIVARMQLFQDDSINAMKCLETRPDVILLDPMFPERQKNSLVKKKLQVLQKLEIPCNNEKELIQSAIEARPKKLVIKRPLKGPYLAEIKPDYSIKGKAIRFDCIVFP